MLALTTSSPTHRTRPLLGPTHSPTSASTYPDEQLGQDHVALAAGQVQCCATVAFPAGLVHLVPRAVCQQQDDCPQVLIGCGTQQVLAQGQLCAGQGRQEELLFVLRPDPPLLLFPARVPGQVWSPLSMGIPTAAFCCQTNSQEAWEEK